MHRQAIFSQFWDIVNYNKTAKKLGTKHNDLIAQGYEPDQKGNGILYQWKNVPLGYYDVPTLNYMIYSKKLWQEIIDNPLIKAALEGNCFWGEADHPDREDVSIKEVACRVSNMQIADHQLIIGDLELMDTPNGLICYKLAQTGRLGNSTRGYGELIPSKYDGITQINDAEGSYLHVCTDMVAFPAVPVASTTILSASLAAVEQGNTDEMLRRLVAQAVERNPTNDRLKIYQAGLEHDESRVRALLIASRAKEKSIRYSIMRSKLAHA